MMLKKLSKINTFNSLLFFFSIIYLINLIFIYKNFYTLNTTGLLLINYDGGFLRRALFGEVVTSLSLFFNFKIQNVFIFFYFINYIIFFYLNYFFLKNFKKNYIFYFFIFSPIYLTFPLSDVSSKYAEFLIQREVFLITFFLFFCYLCKKINRRLTVYYSGLTIILISTFIYELTILCYPFFFYAYYLFLKERKFSINISEFIFAVSLLSTVIFLHIYLYGKNDFQIVIDNLNTNFGLKYSADNFIFSWLNQDVSEQLIFLQPSFKISFVLKYLFYSHPIFILIYLSYKNFTDKIAFSLIILSVVSFLIVFVIAIDWARFVHILYCLTLHSILLLIYNNKDFFEHNPVKKYLSKYNQKFLNFLVLSYCVTWTLEHTYWQNHLSYGLLYILKKNFLYFY